MTDKKFVGTFQSESQVLNKIDELKAQGYEDNDIYVVSNNADTLSIVRGQTDVDLQSPDGNWLDKFIAFLSGEEPVRGAFTNMGFTEDESDHYYTAVKNGEILLYVDREYGNMYRNQDTNFQTGYTDPNIGSNLVAEDNADTNLASNRDRLNTDANREQQLHLHEEKLVVDKERIQAGEVNVNKYVVEDVQTVEVPVTREEVYIERQAVTNETAAGAVFDDGEHIHIPIMEERIEVTKRPVVSEEIIVGKREIHDTETVSERVRHEEADIDRTNDVMNEVDRALDENFKTNQYDRNRTKDNSFDDPQRF